MILRDLELSLHPGSTVPCNLSWRIDQGYLQVASWSEQGESCTLGLWGPGDLVIPSLMAFSPLQLVALSTARILEANPDGREREAFLMLQSQQISTLLKLSRTRPAEARLFHLLTWMGERFGRVSRRGVSLCFEEMNLTHRSLAEISGLTRVTVTKAISHFRQVGALVREGEDEWLLPEAWSRRSP
ncbi:MAG: Crp/Fnr family transcriptional regulator [Cyanobacteriota bacterium]